MASLSVDDRLPTVQLDPHPWQALALVCVAFFMTVLDGPIVTVALPTIAGVAGRRRSRHLLRRPLRSNGG